MSKNVFGHVFLPTIKTVRMVHYMYKVEFVPKGNVNIHPNPNLQHARLTNFSDQLVYLRNFSSLHGHDGHIVMSKNVNNIDGNCVVFIRFVVIE